jgi:hypothetical protein
MNLYLSVEKVLACNSSLDGGQIEPAQGKFSSAQREATFTASARQVFHLI